MNFFVMGLPRSRTAWMAAYLTASGLLCYHEGLNGCRTMQEYRDKIGSAGDSSSGTILFDIDKVFPVNKKIIIHRDIKASLAFNLKTYGHDLHNEMEYYDYLLGKADGLHVRFYEINQRLPEIWDFLTDKPFQPVIADLFMRLNIQVLNPYDYDVESIQSLLKEAPCHLCLQ